MNSRMLYHTTTTIPDHAIPCHHTIPYHTMPDHTIPMADHQPNTLKPTVRRIFCTTNRSIVTTQHYTTQCPSIPFHSIPKASGNIVTQQLQLQTNTALPMPQGSVVLRCAVPLTSTPHGTASAVFSFVFFVRFA